jgi:transposase
LVRRSVLSWARGSTPLSFPRIEEASAIRSSLAGEAREVRSEFCKGAVRLVRETGKPIAQVARDLIHEGTLGNWIARDRVEGGEAEGADPRRAAELAQLRREVAEFRMERVP